MKTIKIFLNLYLNRKIKNDTIGLILNLFIALILWTLILTLIEKDAFLNPIIKIF